LTGPVAEIVSPTANISEKAPIATMATQRCARASAYEQPGQEGGDNDPVNQIAAYRVDLTIPSFGIQEENHFPADVHELLPGRLTLRAGYLYGNGEPWTVL
jgi:hypothetical protein